MTEMKRTILASMVKTTANYGNNVTGESSDNDNDWRRTCVMISLFLSQELKLGKNEKRALGHLRPVTAASALLHAGSEAAQIGGLAVSVAFLHLNINRLRP